MKILDIRNKSERVTELRPVHVEEIKAYLEALDLIDDIPVRYAFGAKEEDKTETPVTSREWLIDFMCGEGMMIKRKSTKHLELLDTLIDLS